MEPTVTAALARIDIGIIAVYLLGIVALGLWVSRRQRTATDFFLASRDSTWPVIGLALLASNISSTTLIGLAGAAYSMGIAVYNYEWMASVVLAFFCVFFLPFLLRSQVFTLPEYLERRYDRRARVYFSALTLFLNIVVDTAGTLYGGALMFKLILPDVPLWQIVSVLALSAGIYTMAGGLRAVMVTETVQALVLLLAAVLISVFAFDKAGGWDAVMQAVDPAKLSLIRPANDPGVPWTGLLFGVPLLGFYFWCTNQFMAQRILSARNLNHGRWGSLFAGLLKLPVLWLMVLPGTCAVLLYPQLSSPDLVYPTLLFDLLPTGVVGVVVAGFLAALMSSIASTFNSAATLVTMDFYRQWRPQADGAALVRAGRITTLVFMVIAVAWAPQIARFESLWQYLQAVLAYAVPPVVALFLVGMFSARANARGAFATIVVGLLGGAGLFYANVLSSTPMGLHFLLVAPILTAGCILTHWVVSRLGTAPATEQVTALLWSRQTFRDETIELRGLPLWQNYRVQAALLMTLTAVIVWLFR
ncbi:MAG: Sodium/glucose cotransporter [Alphaproteobacteria bacterium ADurb.BinA280]|jgi:SSS family solute:Na+ symporter|nr:MAG: Sodium/glucose cotransporter [Alphaproteobacteria bacterium ADurb.BinA280]